MQMNDNLRKWIDALRSGKYKQSTGSLYKPSEGGHCCLGVACETLGLERDEHGCYFSLVEDELGDRPVLAAALDDPELEELGMTNVDQQELIRLNDNHRFTFEDIADVVEAAATQGVDVADICEQLTQLTTGTED